MTARGATQRRELPAGQAGAGILFADLVAMTAIVLVATDGLAPDVSLIAKLGLVLWATVPRIAAEWIERPGDILAGAASRRTYVMGALFFVILIVAGRGVLSAFSWSAGGSVIGMPLALLCTIVGFVLRDAGAWRLFEPLACLTMLAGIVRGSTFALGLVAIAFLTLCLSAALRRQLAVVPTAKAVTKAVGRHARVAALAITALLLAVFLLANLGIERVMSLVPTPKPKRPPAEAPRPRPDGRDAGGSDRSTFRLGVAGPIRPPSLRRNAVPDAREGAPAEEILRITPAFQPRSIGLDTEWVPAGDTLWRGWSYVRFDPAKQEWTQQRPSDWVPPTGNSRVIRLNPASTTGGATTWSLEVKAPELEVVVIPYFTEWVNLTNAGKNRPEVLMNPDGDLFLSGGGIQAADGYDVTLRPLTTPIRFAALAAGQAPSPEYLEVPDRAAIGIDLDAYAQDAAGTDDRSLEEKLARLRGHFREDFRFLREADPRELPNDLAEFLTGKRLGDCRHLATATVLLLRASGVPARLATGFKGASRPMRSDEYVVYGSSAHAWVEILTDIGWVPIDPVQWMLEEDSLAPEEPEEAVEPPAPPSEKKRLTEIVLLLGVMLVIFAFLWTRTRRKKAAEKAEAEEEVEKPKEVVARAPGFVPRTLTEQLLVDYGRMQSDLAATGHERRTYESPREHARRVATTVPRPPKEAFDSLVPLVDDGLYGEVAITDVDLSRGRSAIDEIRRELS